MSDARQENSVRVVLEVDGSPVGFVNIDLDRLWPVLDLRRPDGPHAAWLRDSDFDTLVRNAVLKRFMEHLKADLYHAFGQSLVKAELQMESVNLKAEAVVQAVGKSREEFENLLAECAGNSAEFYSFLHQYLTGEVESSNPRKEWKTWLAARKRG